MKLTENKKYSSTPEKTETENIKQGKRKLNTIYNLCSKYEDV